MGYIYSITNDINGKKYIGKTQEMNPFDRWKDHIRDSIIREHENRPLYGAMRKYGKEHFYFEIIEEAQDGDVLCEREKYYIKKYHTYVGFNNCNGYNATLGGEGKPYIDLDEDEVIKWHNENGQVLSYTAHNFNVCNDTIKKVLKSHNIHWLNRSEFSMYKFYREYGGIVMLDFDCTEILNIEKSMKPFLILNQKFNEHTITNALSASNRQKTHHAYGYTWYRLNELPEEYKPLLNDYYERTLDNDNQELEDLIFD